MACKAQAAFAPQTAGIHSYYHGKIEELESVFREKAQNLRRLEAQRNELNGKVRLLREELQLLQEPGSYVGEVVKAMGKTKVLVKVNPEGKYVVDLDKNIDVTEIKPNLRVALRNDSYVLHKVGPGASAQGVGVCVCSSAQRCCQYRVSVLAFNSVTSAFVFTYASVNRMCHMCTDTLDAQIEHRFGSVLSCTQILPSKVDPLVSLMRVEKVPDSTYETLGGLDKQVKEIKEVIELPIKHPEIFESLGISQPKGVILYGPPGTGKTLLARAVAHHTDCCFIRVSGSELVQKYIGEGSRMVRELFVMARESAPSIIFMDEIDSIGSSRIEGSEGGDSEVQRTMLELLNQLDGFESASNIKVLMATNRLDILDDALIRPGRIDRKIEFPNPNEAARADILKIHSRKMNLMRSRVFLIVLYLVFVFHLGALTSEATLHRHESRAPGTCHRLTCPALDVDGTR